MNKRIRHGVRMTYESTFTFIKQTDLFDLYEQRTVATPNSGWPDYTPFLDEQTTSLSVLKRVRNIEDYCAAKGIDLKKAMKRRKPAFKDRPKTFFTLPDSSTISDYVAKWQRANHLTSCQS